jgi:hypothetical protein
VSTSDKLRDPDIGTIVLASTAFTRDKNDKLLFHQHFQEQAGISQHIAQVQTVFQTGQARPVQSKSLSHQHGISRVRPKISAIGSTT